MSELVEFIFGLIITLIMFLMIYNPPKHGPNSNIIKKLTYDDNGRKYKLKPEIRICPI